MRTGVLILLWLVSANAVSGQLIITPGAQLHMSGNVQLIVHNMDLINNGGFSGGNGAVWFTGNRSAMISGSQPIQFYELGINKTGGNSIMLHRSLGISGKISFTAGFLNLNGHDVALAPSAFLNGEGENSHITGSNGGEVTITKLLNVPFADNPGNLGAVITSSQLLGSVTVARGHTAQMNASGAGSSILRYFTISPDHNTALNATLRFYYFNGELNGLDEHTLVLWKQGSSSWSNEGATYRNTDSNYVEKSGIPSFSRWTLSGAQQPMPAQFNLFNAKCEGDDLVLTWITTREENTDHFSIERSESGGSWTVVGTLPAAGTSSTERTYTFTDITPPPQVFYRIAQYHIDGRVRYSSILRAGCSMPDLFGIWPNPFRDIIFVNFVSADASQAVIKLFDAKGALIRVNRTNVLPGSNQIQINMASLPKAAYILVLEKANGRRQTRKIIKQ